MEKLIEVLSDASTGTAAVALATVVLTGIIKLPLKKLAAKFTNCKKITRFVVFLPVILGFGLTVLLAFFVNGKVDINGEFYMQWLSAVSLSLAIYAFLEKFVPSEKKILSEAEINANTAVVEKLKDSLPTDKKEDQDRQSEAEQPAENKKIILTNHKN